MRWHPFNCKISVTIIATGFEHNSIPEIYSRKKGSVESIPLYEDVRKPMATQPVFEVKTIDNTGESRQRSLEFEISNVVEPTLFPGEFEVKVNKSKSAERLIELKKTQAKANDVTPSPVNPIDEMENQPAYVRKKINLGEMSTPTGDEISKVTLSDDPDRKVVLKKENRYLNKKVD